MLRIILLLFGGATAAEAQTTYAVGSAPFTASSRLDGGFSTSFLGKNGVAHFSNGDQVVRWTGSHSTIDVTVYDAGNGGPVCLYQDGNLVGTCYFPPNVNDWQTSSGQWTGLSGTHVYTLGDFNSFAGAGANYIAEVIVSGGTGLGAQPPLRQSFASCGDSITVYVSSAIYDTRQGDAWQVALPNGIFDVRFGVTGIQVSNYMASNQLVDQCPAQTYVTAPQVIQLNGGVNDMNANATVGTAGAGCTAGTFKCDYYNMIAGVSAANPTAKIVSRGILPNSYGTYPALNPNIATWNGYIQAVIAQWNSDNPTKTVAYMDPTGWFPPDTGTVEDHLHPTVASYAAIANNEIPVLAGYASGSSFSVTGPSSGKAGLESSPFTVTLGGGASFNSLMPIPLNDGGDGGIFTPSVGSPGIGPLVVTPSSGNSFTFTYTAASAGTKTISYSGLPDWTTPSPSSYMASPGSGNGTRGASLGGILVH